MAPSVPPSSSSRSPVPITKVSRRWIVALGVLSLCAGGVAVFATTNQAGTVALIAVGAVLTMVGLGGFLPTKLKFGESEANWQSEVTEVIGRVNQGAQRVEGILEEQGVSFMALALEPSRVSNFPLEQVTDAARDLGRNVNELELIAGRRAVPADAWWQLAKASLAEGDWFRASKQLERLAESREADWEVFFLLGTALANRRAGEDTDRAAVQAYDNAIALAPFGKPTPLMPRMYSYRAGVKKRLDRLHEAKADALVALQMAQSRFDRIDATYNLACIESLLNDKVKALAALKELETLGGLSLAREHVNDYFKNLRNEPEFRRLFPDVGSSD